VLKQAFRIREGTGIRQAFFLNLGFTLFELVGGVMTNSLAILSDAVHDLGDSLSLGLAWYLANYSEKKRDRKYSYGYRRFSLLGALANAVILLTGSLFILSEAVPRLLRPEQPKAEGMALLAIAGIVINGWAALRVRGGKTLNARVITWHLLEDVLGWAAILAVSLVLLFKDLPVLDPLLSILITSYVLYNVLKNLKKTVEFFLQAVPGGIDIVEIEKKLLGIGKVKAIHHTHVWTLDGEHNIFTTHLVVDSGATREDVLRIRNQVEEMLEDMNFEHTTVEIGYENQYCRMKER
jgi:cobalt-zinc-cadmium efflux system protein